MKPFQKKSSSSVLILRADGNKEIGLGHIYRLLALAEILRRSYTTILFATSVDTDFIVKQIHDICDGIIRLPAFNYVVPSKYQMEEIPFDLHQHLTGQETVITDGYWFGTKYQAEVKERGCKLVCIDDLIEWHFLADMVINHGMREDTGNRYKKESYTRLCLGLGYAILRKVFFRELTDRSQVSPCVYVCLGGTDHYGYTHQICDMILQQTDANVQVVVSDLYTSDQRSKLGDLQKKVASRISINSNISGEGICDLLDNCTHAVTSASTVAMECVFRGIKPLIGYYTENQVNIYELLLQRQLASGIGNFGDIKQDQVLDYLRTEQLLSKPLPSSFANLINVIL
jgi:UDP-2,4-diacetamido-2,4,6-trideoxy-beta-L-altropyranose hydrolase